VLIVVAYGELLLIIAIIILLSLKLMENLLMITLPCMEKNKTMSKAEDRYLEHFQDVRLRNCSSKEAFLLGYHQAEKDNELTWEDISIIRQIMFDYNRTIRNGVAIPNDEEYCQEVLKRFKERKEEL
jgi:hypothetical protein